MRDPEFFARLDHDIRTLLRDLTEGWTADEIDSVRADVGYGEWKLAIEQLAGGIVRLNKPLTPELLAKIDDLAQFAGASFSDTNGIGVSPACSPSCTAR